MKKGLFLAVLVLVFAAMPVFAQDRYLDFCDRTSDKFDFNLCGWQWAGKLAVDKQELNAELNALEENYTEVIGNFLDLSRENATLKNEKDALQTDLAATQKSDAEGWGLYVELAAANRDLVLYLTLALAGVVVLATALAAVIINSRRRGQAIGQLNEDYDVLYGRLEDMREKVFDLNDEARIAMEEKNDVVEALDIAISERNKLRQRVAETEHQNFQVVVTPEELKIRDKEAPDKIHSLPVTPKPKNWHRHYRKTAATEPAETLVT